MFFTFLNSKNGFGIINAKFGGKFSNFLLNFLITFSQTVVRETHVRCYCRTDKERSSKKTFNPILGRVFLPPIRGGGAKLPRSLSRIQENGPMAVKLPLVGRRTLKRTVLTKNVDVTSLTLLTSAFLSDPKR